MITYIYHNIDNTNRNASTEAKIAWVPVLSKELQAADDTWEKEFIFPILSHLT